MPPCDDGNRGGTVYVDCDTPKTLERLKWVTRAACDMRTILRRFGLEKHLAGETLDWIKEHDETDRRRIAQETEKRWREEQRKLALSTLTEADKVMLGLTTVGEISRRKALRKLTMDQRRILGL